MLLERGELLEHPVVGEQPPLLLEGMGVAPLERPSGGEADVGEEPAREDLPRLTGEAGVVVGGDRLLADVRMTLAVEPSEAGAVGLAVALGGDAVRGLQQPEGGSDGLARGAHTEQATHARDTTRPRADDAALRSGMVTSTEKGVSQCMTT